MWLAGISLLLCVVVRKKERASGQKELPRTTISKLRDSLTVHKTSQYRILILADNLASCLQN